MLPLLEIYFMSRTVEGREGGVKKGVIGKKPSPILPLILSDFKLLFLLRLSENLGFLVNSAGIEVN